jgi:5-methyltetrahydrofolate--homocysteine methyltransferase
LRRARPHEGPARQQRPAQPHPARDRRSICERFAAAGADILATNTFNANAHQPGRLWRRGLVGDINRAAARIIREVADRYSRKDGKPRWVAGALGPTNKTLSLSPDVNDPGFREVDFDR